MSDTAAVRTGGEAARASAAGWPGPRPFVGRGEILDDLLAETAAVAGERGRAVFLVGPVGTGKSALLGVFQELAYRRHRKLDAQYIDCLHTGPGNEAWVQLSRLLTRDHRMRRSVRRAGTEWLEVVPVLGDLAKAIVATVNAVRTGRAEVPEDEELRGADAASAVAHVRLLLRHDPLEHRLVILDNLEEADEHELAGSFALLRQLERTRTLFVGGVSTVGGRPRDEVERLMLEAERLGRTRVMRLPALGAEALRVATAEATRSDPPAAWLDWLVERAEGRPGELWKALGSLVEEGRLRERRGRWIWPAEPPESEGSAAAPPEPPGAERDTALRTLAGLPDGDRRVLELASVQGTVFRSGAVAALGRLDELAVEDRLATLARRGFIEYRRVVETDAVPDSEYAFRDRGLRDACLAGLAPAERRDLEARLEEAVGPTGPSP